MRCLVVDDDNIQTEIIKQYIGKDPQLQLVKACDNAMEASNILADADIDILFLDVQMPGMSGIELIKTLKKKPYTIFITAHEQYALDAFKLEADDYLVKPVKNNDFLKAINKAREKLKNPVSFEELFIKEGTEIINIKTDEILWLQAEGDYVKIITVSTSYMTLTSLVDFEKKLPKDHFIRIHRSYLVNKKKIKKVSGYAVLMENEEIIPVSRNYKAALITSLNII